MSAYRVTNLLVYRVIVLSVYLVIVLSLYRVIIRQDDRLIQPMHGADNEKIRHFRFPCCLKETAFLRVYIRFLFRFGNYAFAMLHTLICWKTFITAVLCRLELQCRLFAVIDVT